MFGVADGFDVVIGNPPYVRADSGEEHLKMRQRILDSGLYQTLWEKWDLYVPFMERSHSLLKPDGFNTLIVSDAYCHAKYAEKSREWFLENSRIKRLDFLGEIKVFDAAVRNLAYLFQKTDGQTNKPERRVHRHEFGTTKLLTTARQRDLTQRVFFPEDVAVHDFQVPTMPLSDICYISVGMVVHANEKKARGQFELRDLVSDCQDDAHPQPFVEGKHLSRWRPSTNKWLEWGTDRAPSLFRRPTFPQLYAVPEKLISVDMAASAARLRVAYDDRQLLHNHSAWSFVPWHSLRGVRNRSIKRQTRYQNETPRRPDLPERENLERNSRQFSIKFLLGVMNSTFSGNFLRANRRSNLHLYPDDWKKLPIPVVSTKQQSEVADLVDRVLATKAVNPDSDIAALEAEIDRLVNDLYGLKDNETADIEMGSA